MLCPSFPKTKVHAHMARPMNFFYGFFNLLVKIFLRSLKSQGGVVPAQVH